jgi:hypothetical protein
MTTPIATSIQSLQRQAASLLLYQSVLCDSVGQAFLNLLQALRSSDAEGINCLYAYGSWFKALRLKIKAGKTTCLRKFSETIIRLASKFS